MMFCTSCGTKLRDGSKFCSSCGKKTNTAEEAKRRHVFEGVIHKCPNCGEHVQAFEVNCKSCGFEFRNVKQTSAVSEFSKRIQDIEANRKSDNMYRNTVRNIFSSFGLSGTSSIDNQVISCIQNFIVPNTKEDVIEFMILASTNVNTSAISAYNFMDAGANSFFELNIMKSKNDAWISKLNQTYHKAKIAFGSDSEFHRIQEMYDQTFKSIKSAKIQKNVRFLKVLLPIMALLLIFVMFFAGLGISHQKREEALEQIVKEIQIDIINEDYDKALIKANGLHMDDGWSNESEKRWNEVRENLIDLINEKKGEND